MKTNPKKILIFSLVYYPKHVHGGAEVAIKEITDRISKDEIEFHMVTLGYDSNLPETSWEGNVLVHRIGLMRPGTEVEDFDVWPLFLNKYLFQFYAAWKARELHKKYHFDATWAMMAHATGVPAAIFKLFHPRVPYILTLQEGDPIEHIERAVLPLWPLFTRAFTKADIVQAISTFLGGWARRRNFKGPLEIIPNGVDTKHFSQTYSEEEMAKVRHEIGKGEGETWLVTTSRLFKKNGLDSVIAALPALPAKVKFLIYGAGPERPALQELSAKAGVGDRVIFGGLLSREVMPKHLKACDIFIRPSRSEGMGNSFIEAFAAGLPVIATQEGGIADFLFDEKRNPDWPTTGWAVLKDAPEQIAAAVKDILARPEKVKEVVKNAKDLAFQKYDWNLIARDMHERVFRTQFKTNTKE